MEITRLTLFDYMESSENPPATYPEPEPEPSKPENINFAKVPDQEFQSCNKKIKVPTVNDILKLLEKGLYKVNAHEFLSDVFECGAIAISNKFDFRNYEKREERYMQIIKRYDKEMQSLIAQVFSEIFILLSSQIDIGFNDYLGQLYMLSNTSNSKAGQFFTPYCVSKLSAEVTINGAQINEYMEQDKILTLNEPTCGAGGMIIAAADVLYNKYHFNISRNLLVQCSDIDSRCVHMTYLQLSLAGIPAVILKQNTLTLETWDKWETPAYIMQWLRFKDVLK